MNMNKKSKGYFIFTIFLNILCSIIVGIVIISLFGGLLNKSYAWVIYALAVLVYIVLAYISAHGVGDNDANCNNTDAKFKSEVCALVAIIPSTVLAILCYLIEIGLLRANTDPAVCVVIYRALHICFRIIFDYFKEYPILYFVPSVLTFVLTVVGYRFGLNRIKISDYLYYAREDKE